VTSWAWPVSTFGRRTVLNEVNCNDSLWKWGERHFRFANLYQVIFKNENHLDHLFPFQRCIYGQDHYSKHFSPYLKASRLIPSPQVSPRSIRTANRNACVWLIPRTIVWLTVHNTLLETHSLWTLSRKCFVYCTSRVTSQSMCAHPFPNPAHVRSCTTHFSLFLLSHEIVFMEMHRIPCIRCLNIKHWWLICRDAFRALTQSPYSVYYIPTKACGYQRCSADISVWLINDGGVTSSFLATNCSPWLRCTNGCPPEIK
jgi:hypothetical protein